MTDLHLNNRKDYSTNYSAADLLKKLEKKGLISPDNTSKDFILKQHQDPDLPFYLKILAGIGAFITSICFIGFLAVAEIIGFNDEIEAMIWGSLFIGAAMSIYRVMGTNHSLKQSFFLQSSFALIATGKLLFIFGATEWFYGSSWNISLTAFIITAVTYPIYRLSIERFLSCTGVLVSVLLNIFWGDNLDLFPDISKDILFNTFFTIQLAVAALLLINPRIRFGFTPLAHALVVSLCISVVFLSSHAEFDYLNDPIFISSLTVNILLTVAMISLIGWASGGLVNLKREPIILGITGAVLLGLLSAPGVILSIGLMIFGYTRHDRVFTLLGALLLPLFLCLYYYNLEITLLQKSGVLICSGVILLAGKFYLKLKGWDKDPEQILEQISEHKNGDKNQGDVTCV